MSASLGVSVRRDGFYKGVVLIDLPILKDLVLIGGGHSHVTVLKQFGMQPLPGAHLTLVSRSVDTPYSGMLPGLIAGHYSYDDSHIDLRMLARFADAKVIVDEAVGLDQIRGDKALRETAMLKYNRLSVVPLKAAEFKRILKLGKTAVR